MKKILAGLVIFTLAGCAAQPRPSVAPASVAAPGLTVPIPPAPPKGEPERFTGLDVSRLRALAGAPAFARKDGNIEMWRYDAGSCRVFFFLTGAPAKVQHVETLPRGKESAADPECLTALSSKRS
jgi:hypothetical protein